PLRRASTSPPDRTSRPRARTLWIKRADLRSRRLATPALAQGEPARGVRACLENLADLGLDPGRAFRRNRLRAVERWYDRIAVAGRAPVAARSAGEGRP